MHFRLVFVAALLLARFALAAEPPAAGHVFFLIGETEYRTAETLPAFARAELEPRGIRCTFSILAKDAEVFPHFDALASADVLLVSVRRQSPPREQMEAIRAHVAAGKPVVGIRTASHAFGKRKGEAAGPWESFDLEVLGGKYDNHYGKGLKIFARVVPEAAGHPVLAGLPAGEFAVPSHLYRYPTLAPTATKLLTARIDGRPEVEPIAWVNVNGSRRAFYTSLGAEEDFGVPAFRRLLRNGILWSLGRPTAGER